MNIDMMHMFIIYINMINTNIINKRRVPAPCPGAVSRHCVNHINTTNILHINMINMSMNIHSIYINIIKMNMNTMNIINKRRVPAPCPGTVSIILMLLIFFILI